MAEEEKERVLTYEVQIWTNNRWEIYSRFPADGKDDAVEVAKELEQNKSTANVKVVKEVFNYQTNSSNEFLVYKSPTGKADGGATAAKAPAPPPSKEKKPEKKAAPPPPRKDVKKPEKKAPRKDAPTAAPDSDDDMEFETKKPKSSLGSVVLKLLVITFLAGAFAAGASTVATMVLKNSLAFGITATSQVREAIVLATFILAFLLSAVPMALYYLSKENLNFSFSLPRRRTAPESQPTAATAEAVKATTKATAGLSFGDRREAERRVAEVLAGDKPPPEPEPAKPVFQMPSAPPAPPPMSAQGEKQKAIMLKYLGDCLAELPPNRKMDNYNKFGVNLFMAGACEAMASEKGLDVLATSRILSDSLQVIGFKKTQADAFADKYQEYLLADSRYMAMFESGRAAMAGQMGGEATATRKLAESIEEWNKPKEATDKQSSVTVMFTDMVGSTALTQNLGDAGAQKVVRAHNSIVRAALGRFGGKEIKHTGDGIMASFALPSNGIKAAIDIQKGAAEHCRANPGLPLRLKVGLHTGEAIAEDGDLFGTHVQLSARITDKAGANEIFVSRATHDNCAGKGFSFANRGEYPLKGFDEPQTVYQVLVDGIVQPPAADKAAEEKRVEEEKKKAEEEKKKAEEAEKARQTEVAQAQAQQADAQAMHLQSQAPQPQPPAPAQPAPQPAPGPARPPA